MVGCFGSFVGAVGALLRQNVALCRSIFCGQNFVISLIFSNFA